eukprot:CAMPEP_0196725854 /NCGR_PEP_ID=MMETSP1091-20130531/7272_1 /TAXON_ID=302021 /ORGANISM="Rhodomonas sp., Strain CCMP768" /LENGTH=87 /DNA_ID=CAMNT_0042068181 /DNA_START=28 /DNA_END=291 /DNA_ORIENTATION=-
MTSLYIETSSPAKCCRSLRRIRNANDLNLVDVDDIAKPLVLVLRGVHRLSVVVRHRRGVKVVKHIGVDPFGPTARHVLEEGRHVLVP